MESRRVSVEGSEHSLSAYQKKGSAKSLKSILKSEVTSFKSTVSPETGTSTPHKKEDGVVFVDVENHESDQFQQFESTADLKSSDKPQSETASIKSVISASIKQTEYDTSSDRKGGVVFGEVEKYDSVVLEKTESTGSLKRMEDESKSDITSFKGRTSASIKQTEQIPHRKEDGVAFSGVEDYGSDQEQFESASGFTPMEDLDLTPSEALSFKGEMVSTKQAKGILHRKEDDVTDSDTNQEEHLESATDLWPLEGPTTSSCRRGSSASMKHSKGIPHRKEDGVAFLDIEDSDSDQEEHLENTTDLWPLERLTTVETPSFRGGSSASMKQAKDILHRKENGVAFLDTEGSDSDLREHLENTTDSLPKHMTTPEPDSSSSETSKSAEHIGHIHSTLQRKADDVDLADKVCDPDQQQQ